MSVRTMARVWERSRSAGSHLLMLLAIADFADDDGNAYPAVQTLAQKCRMKSRNANVILAALRASGELQVKQNEGPHGTNLYRIVLADQPLQNSTGVQSLSGVQSLAPPPAKDCSKPLQRIADEPSVNHQEPSVKSKSPGLVKKKRNPEITLSQFLESCRQGGEKAIPENDPIFEYAGKIGITDEMISVAWSELKASYLQSDKAYRDWRQTFRNAIRRNWFKLWYIADSGDVSWTTVGEQARRAAA